MKIKKQNRIFFTVFSFSVMVLFLSGTAMLSAQHQNRQRTQHRYRGGRSGRPLNIVCSFSDYAAIAKYITGGEAQISFIAHGEQDPHFVPPKPSFAMMLTNADLWITTGMDLEMWSSTLLDKARNRQIMDGEIGFVSVSDGINILQKLEKLQKGRVR